MRQQLAIVLFSLGLLILIFGSVVAGFAANEIYFLRPAKDAEQVTVTIPEGASLKQISRTLADQKLISSPRLFAAYIRWRNLDQSLLAGTFIVSRGMSMRSISKILSSPGKFEATITTIEGWTIKDMGEYLTRQNFDGSGFISAASKPETFMKEFSFLSDIPRGYDLEGYLFPDTYRVFQNATVEDIINKMIQNFKAKVGRLSYDDLILASIIEREVSGDEDRRLVADIFKRRLKLNWALQADSTVNYITGKNTPSISSADRDTDSPYNTYKHRGLPPGPISNPGLSSINAVRNPESNKYWFFLTDDDGNVHYAETLDGHNENKARYLR